uniref:Uncharacterized protein n=1 Tax=Strombidinopsis acuminata TaxID=141414 RepID=A0A7S3WWG7_9SPIT|mmetsp:Transcript_62493/g.160991  ORF Transcript_62493/g.160991 Transcript_62493/m.160991 type:complete len:128 (-) Transcript_62493:82-465(-)
MAFRTVLLVSVLGFVSATKYSGAYRKAMAEPLHPSCVHITCADIECLAPFTLTRSEGQCCAICYAPDNVVALDRHTALQGNNPYAREVHAAAPTTCAGAKCFHQPCMSGYTLGHVQGRCCESCVPGR